MNAIDLFAGAGGFSTGATAAGCRVVWAANHWPAAVAVHAANHPGTAHACQDLQQADWTAVPAHDVLLASQACQLRLAIGARQVQWGIDAYGHAWGGLGSCITVLAQPPEQLSLLRRHSCSAT